MPSQEPANLEFRERLLRVEQNLRAFKILFLLLLGTLALTTYLAMRPLLKEDSKGVLRVRGLVIDDQQGRERILVGAPVPQVAGRKRKDAMTGLLILGENGVDRVALGAPTPDPQKKGVVVERVGATAGLDVNDEKGDERGGFGVLDNDDRVILGMDYPSGANEAITLGVIPNQGVSIAIHDSTSLVRAALSQRNDSPALLYGINPGDKSRFNLGIVRLSPFATKNTRVSANGGDFAKALDGMRP